LVNQFQLVPVGSVSTSSQRDEWSPNGKTGSYQITFDASHSDEGQNLLDGKAGLASGIYVYQITSGNFVESKKMILMKLFGTEILFRIKSNMEL